MNISTILLLFYALLPVSDSTVSVRIEGRLFCRDARRRVFLKGIEMQLYEQDVVTDDKITTGYANASAHYSLIGQHSEPYISSPAEFYLRVILRCTRPVELNDIGGRACPDDVFPQLDKLKGKCKDPQCTYTFKSSTIVPAEFLTEGTTPNKTFVFDMELGKEGVVEESCPCFGNNACVRFG